VKILLNAGANGNVTDRESWTALTYSLYHGNLEVSRLLADQVGDTITTQKPAAPSSLFNTSQAMEVELDDIPDLSLPPPMMPFRVYGHSYLVGKTQLTLHFDAVETECIKFYEARQSASLKLIITSNPDYGVPYSRILPFAEEQEPLTFTLDSFSGFCLNFEIMPTVL
jgi:CDK inhibitor PHO81